MLSSSTSFLSFSCRFLILQVLRFTMRDWLALPITATTTTTNEEQQQQQQPSWFTILNVFSIAKKINTQQQQQQQQQQRDINMKKDDEQEIDQHDDDNNAEIMDNDVNKDTTNKEQEEEDSDVDEEEEESRLPRTFSSSSIATSTDTEHSTTTHDKYNYNYIKLYWNHGGNKVQVTGEFDNWSGSVNMVREAENGGRYVVEIPMDTSKDIEYKFVVDGEWKYAIDLPHRSDIHGNINNVIYKK